MSIVTITNLILGLVIGLGVGIGGKRRSVKSLNGLITTIGFIILGILINPLIVKALVGAGWYKSLIIPLIQGETLTALYNTTLPSIVFVLGFIGLKSIVGLFSLLNRTRVTRKSKRNSIKADHVEGRKNIAKPARTKKGKQIRHRIKKRTKETSARVKRNIIGVRDRAINKFKISGAILGLINTILISIVLLLPSIKVNDLVETKQIPEEYKVATVYDNSVYSKVDDILGIKFDLGRVIVKLIERK